MDIQTLLRHLPEDVAKRLELRARDIAYMERLEADKAALEADKADMAALLAKFGQAAPKFASRPDSTRLIVLDYGAQCGEFGMWERWVTVGDLREAQRWGGGG